MFKKILIIIAIILAAAVAAAFIYRYQIIQYSAEKIVRSFLPDYIAIDSIRFDAQNRAISLNGFRVVNPPDFSYKYLLEISAITCRYDMRGKTLLDGLNVTEMSFKNLTLTIERRSDGLVNLNEMQKMIERAPKAGAAPGSEKNNASSSQAGSKKLSDILKLPDIFKIKDGKVLFLDRLPSAKPIFIAFENVQADAAIRLNDSYSRLIDFSTTGTGNINGDQTQSIRWVISLNPTQQKLTMSNRFEVFDVMLTTFAPYYDKYSPFVFNEGKFSGTLVFDFDNGNIGSTNEVRLSNLSFVIKPGYENAQFWETTVQDLAKYFTSSTGEVVFDFKLKGDMKDPKFHLGPISKQALISMGIDKASVVIQSLTKQSSDQSGNGNADKTQQYLDLIKGLMNKQQK